MSTLRVNNLTRAGGSGIPSLGGVAGNRLTPTAWVNFNGQGTVAIRDSHNVASITDNGTGDYTVNFSTPLDNANYAAVTTVSANALADDTTSNLKQAGVSAAGFSFWSVRDGGTVTDPLYCMAVVFGGKA